MTLTQTNLQIKNNMVLNSQLPETHYILQSRLYVYSLQTVWWIHLDPALDISAV